MRNDRELLKWLRRIGAIRVGDFPWFQNELGISGEELWKELEILIERKSIIKSYGLLGVTWIYFPTSVRQDIKDKVYDFLIENGLATKGALVESLEIESGCVGRVLKDLVDDGLVSKKGWNYSVQIGPSDLETVETVLREAGITIGKRAIGNLCGFTGARLEHSLAKLTTAGKIVEVRGKFRWAGLYKP